MPTKPPIDTARLEKLKQLFSMVSDSLTREEFTTAFKTVVDYVKRVEAQLFNNFRTLTDSLNAKIDARLATLKDGQDGKDGRDSTVPGPIGPIGPMGPMGPKGDKGDPGISPQLPIFDPISAELIRNELEALKGDERLKAEAVQGLTELQDKVKEIAARPSGGHSPSGPTLMVGGTKKGRALNLNFKAGSNTTVSHSYNNGQHDITISSTGGGGGFSTLTATETPNGSRTAFTFPSASAQPSYLVVDNVWMKATSAAGTVNWTWSAGTLKATLTVPAQDDIFAIV